MSNSLPLEQLEQQLERAIENVRQVGFQGDNLCYKF